MITERRVQPELMDQPDLDPLMHVAALDGLRRINLVSRSAAILWPEIEQLAREVAPRPLRVLDIACGGGDNAASLVRHAVRAGREVHVDGCDVSECALEVARRRVDQSGANQSRFFPLNVLVDPLPAGYDVITTSLFLHHLQEQQACDLLRRMAAAAGRAVLVCDLHRSWLGYGLAWVGCRLLSRSPIVHVDGPRSVEAAFAIDEIGALAARSGLTGALISHHWPQRWLLAWRKR
ncbi:MAG TPA: methyltransferase domain-containing protein [Pirellulales bacterium]|nr:methyltransferase domain-containing protein [Pirellulales bacterium]